MTYLEGQIEKALHGTGELKDMNPGIAIAYAILRLADAQRETAVALHCLGTGNSATDLGAIELLSNATKYGMAEIASSIDGMREEIERLANASKHNEK